LIVFVVVVCSFAIILHTRFLIGQLGTTQASLHSAQIRNITEVEGITCVLSSLHLAISHFSFRRCLNHQFLLIELSQTCMCCTSCSVAKVDIADLLCRFYFY